MKRPYVPAYFYAIAILASCPVAAAPTNYISNYIASANISVSPTPALSSVDFINSMGVNTHIIYKDGAYANSTKVLNDLEYLGISHVRDSIPYAWNPGTANVGDYEVLAKGGISFDLLVNGSISIKAPNNFVTQNLEVIDIIAKAIPGKIDSIEGLNEINNSGVPEYKGLTGVNAAVAIQEDLYTAIHTDDNLSSKIVFDMTGAPETTSIEGRADFENAHPYPHNAQQPYSTIRSGFSAYGMATYPKVITEIGNFSLPLDWTTTKAWWDGYTMLGINEANQAKSIINSYFDAVLMDISRTYVYELLDEKPDPNNTQAEMHFGLFRNDHSPKPAATAIRNLIAILNSSSGAMNNVSSQNRLAYSVTPSASGTSAISALLLQKQDGTFDLVLWNNNNFWNWANNSMSVPSNDAPIPATLEFGQKVSSLKIFDPLIESTALTSMQNVQGVQGVALYVPDHPIIVEIVLASGCADGTSNGSTVWQNGAVGSSSRAATSAECSNGGTITSSWTNQSQAICTSGVLEATGQTQITNLTSETKCNQAPADVTSHISIQATGDQAGGAPVMKVYLNGKLVNTTSITAIRKNRQSQTVTFDVTTATKPSVLTIAFLNDLDNKLGDRNLYVTKLSVDNKSYNLSNGTMYNTSGKPEWQNEVTTAAVSLAHNSYVNFTLAQ